MSRAKWYLATLAIGNHHIQTAFHFFLCFLLWTLSRTWTLLRTETRLTPVDPGSPLHSACGLTRTWPTLKSLSSWKSALPLRIKCSNVFAVRVLAGRCPKTTRRNGLSRSFTPAIGKRTCPWKSGVRTGRWSSKSAWRSSACSRTPAWHSWLGSTALRA